jgi:Domain of unknown function (DUF4177)
MEKFEHKIVEIPMKGWMRYKIDVAKLEATMNALGNEGWNVSTVIPNVYLESSYRGNMIILSRKIN